MKLRIRYILYELLITALVIIFAYMFISEVLAVGYQQGPIALGAPGVSPAEPATGNIQKLENDPKAYAFKGYASYKDFDLFPIDAEEFNKSPDRFCAQHHTPYGSFDGPHTIGDDYHVTHMITKHKVSSKTSDPKGDIDTSALIYIDEDLNVNKDKLATANLDGYRKVSETPNNTVITNWVYKDNKIDFDCEGRYTGPRVGSGSISDGGMAFLLACFKQTEAERLSTGYSGDPLQHAVWDWFGQGGGSSLRTTAETYDRYHEKSKTPGIDTAPEGDDFGTTIDASGTTYTVGPFMMSDFYEAKDEHISGGTYKVTSISTAEYDALSDAEKADYTVTSSSTYEKYEFIPSTGGSGETLQDRFTSVSGKNNSESDYNLQGSIVEAYAILTNESGATKEIKLPFIPEGGKTYNITFTADEIKDYDELLDIKFIYQRIHAAGCGTWWDGRQYKYTFEEKDSEQSSCSYSCKKGCSRHDESCSPGSSDTPYTETCEHTWCINCTESNCSDPECTSCPHHSCGGTDSDSHTGDADAPYTYTCGHDHGNCWYFHWTNDPSETRDFAQDGFAGAGWLQTSRDTYIVRVAVPLKTQMAIYKYITKVDHVGEDLNLFNGGDSRKYPDLLWQDAIDKKHLDTVKVERGDKVEYEVVLENKSRFPTQVKVKDTLPELNDPNDCVVLEIPPEIQNSEWITIDAKSENKYKIVIRPTQDTGDSGCQDGSCASINGGDHEKYNNVIEFITKNNGTAEHMRFEKWGGEGKTATHGEHHYGNIVNTKENYITDPAQLREKDADTYEIKEYNVSVEKFIYDVSHNEDVDLGSVANGVDTSAIHNSEERNRKTLGSTAESIKESNPVYVEYGDKVTYKIVVYNTTDNTGTDFDVNSRDNDPYWQPDKVYVNIKDTLPQKYSDLEVIVEPAPTPLSIPGTSSAGENEHSISIGATESNSGGEFTITDLMVPAGQTRTVTVKLKVEEYEKGTIEENNAKFDPEEIRNINKGPNGRAEDKFCVIKNHSTNLTTSDWYILNNYNTFTDKYVYKYDEKMQHQNNNPEMQYSEGGYVTNGDGSSPAELIESRRNQAPGTDTVKDALGNIDEVKVVDTKEDYKKQFPVSVEKTETLIYRIAITNESKEVNTIGAINSGRKVATQVRTSTVKDKMQEGITQKGVTAAIYSDENGENKRVDVAVSSNLIGTEEKDGRTFNVYEYTIGNETIVNPGETIIYEVTVLITESNMYLFDLENNATLTRLTNINHTDSENREIKNEDYNEDISPQDKEGSSDFVRMKDLVIGGWVWVDFNKNGLKDDEKRDDSDKAYFNIDDKAGKRDVVVKLYRDTEANRKELIRTTKTDDKGFYTFGRGSDNAFGWRKFDYNYSDEPPTSSKYEAEPNRNFAYYQRVEKATGKDNNGNYTANSELIRYYIEFEYDGVVFKSTEFYSGMDNIEEKKDSSEHSFGEAFDPYKNPGDSNALEFTDVREEFNKKYEYVGYDRAYDLDKTNGVSLAFDKTNHTSQLIDDPSRTITARSFIKADTVKSLLEDPEVNGDYNKLDHKKWNPSRCDIKNANGVEDNSTTNLLWLFKFDDSEDYDTPETEYLKDINLGLELREDVDITLEKDVYSIQTTINGEQMEYFYNQNNGFNGEVKEQEQKEENGKYLKDYIIKTPYGLDLYESDYKMRVEQYKSNAVKAYKGLNGESELNVEVTYRITIANKSINDDESLPKDNIEDTKLKVRISEILDLYDSNFEKVFDDDTEAMNAPIPIKLTNDNGYFEDKEIKLAEAWYFKEDSEGEYIVGEGTFPSTYEKDEVNKNINDAGYVFKSNDAKPVFVKLDSTSITDEGVKRYKKVELKLSPKSILSETEPTLGNHAGKENSNDFTDDGYNTMYISGMEYDEDGITPIYIEEGKDFDIYVKYVLDKDTLETEDTNEDYEDTIQETFYINDADENSVKVVVNKSDSSTKIQRSLKLKDNFGKTAETERGIENIAQVNLYSVWYEDEKPTSLVDMDSNVGNIGNINDELVENLKDVTDTDRRKQIIDEAKNKKNEKDTNEKFINYTSADEWNPFYEDTIYKTGVEITADGTEWTQEQAKEMHGELEVRENETIRELTGMVWDDSRSEADNSNLDAQYSGDGIYDLDKEKQEKALDNINIPTNYDNDVTINDNEKTKEIKDFKVRNAKVELIEVVEIPQGNGTSHYYEEILRDVTWKQAQHIRTNADGLYTVKGFIPGKYIVRFTYGDTIRTADLTQAEISYSSLGAASSQNPLDYVATDMQIFNGQDYKTTKYAYNLSTDYSSETENFAEIPVNSGTIDVYAARHKSTTGEISDNDIVLAALERADLSDARDDEIRRLEVNNYSEIMVNEKAEILKGLANSTGLSETKLEGEASDTGLSIDYYKYFQEDSYETEKEKYLRELTDNTYMEAETVEFLVKPEKLTYQQTTEETYYKKLSGDNDLYYNDLDTIVNKIVTKRKYKIENIDMGIEYRPETNISLTKEIDTVQLVTSDNEILVDLKLKTKLENGRPTHYIDVENSTGADNVKIVSNTYDIDPLLAGIVNVYEEQRQGFIFVEIDDEILQGCRAIITYKFAAQNNSEVDRISNRLNEIRFYGNSKTSEMASKYSENYSTKEFTDDGSFEVLKDIETFDTTGNEKDGTEYTANHFAKNMVKFDVYAEDGDNILYRNRPKTMILDASNTTEDIDGSNGYFGKYVGYTYYVGNSNLSDEIKTNKDNLDTISELKFDVVIDYIDTGLEFEQVSQSDGIKFSEVINNDVISQFAVANQSWLNTSTLPVTNLSRYLFKLSSPWSELTSILKGITATSVSNKMSALSDKLQEVGGGILKDIEGVRYKSVVMTVADKKSDDDDKNNNELFSKFLQPRVVAEDESIATVYLPASKLLATETNTENMVYENIAEVSQFTVLTGRRTNFDTTIGNVDIHEVLKQNEENKNRGDDPYDKYGSIEYVTAALETDTSSTETITFTPPTGLMKNRRAIFEAIDTTHDVTKTAVIAIAVVVSILIITKLTLVKIKKKRYK